MGFFVFRLYGRKNSDFAILGSGQGNYLATHLLKAGYDIRTVKELSGHSDLHTRMIYPHVLNHGPAGIRSPVDRL